MKNKIYFLCQDIDTPVGGIKELYRHVDILNRNGFTAFILHARKGFRCTWFENSTRVAYKSGILKNEWLAAIELIKDFLLKPFLNPFYLMKCVIKFLSSPPYRSGRIADAKRFFSVFFAGMAGCVCAQIDKSDYLVIPEVYGQAISGIEKGVRKVILNQNAHYTFNQHLIYEKDFNTPYSDADTIAAIVISAHSFDYLKYLFPGLKLTRVHNGIDSRMFRYSADKKRRIAFMPRKLPVQVRQVLGILKTRGAVKDFELVPIDNKTEEETAGILRESLIFLSFSTQEGCPMPPMEAMACGCIVIGYHGSGGREYFREEFCYPVEAEDTLGFAKAVEAVIKEYEKDKTRLIEKGKRASEFILKEYSMDKEEKEVVDFWKDIFRQKNPEAARTAPL